jgi:hypothetical protein
MSASDVARMQRKLDPAAFPHIRCAADHTTGWDYVCTYRDPKLGQQKMGVLVHGDDRFTGSGSVSADAQLPDGPRTKAPSAAAYAKRVNAVCAQRAAAVQALPPPGSRKDLLDIGQQVITLEEQEQSQIAGFKRPRDERAQVTAFLRSVDGVQRAIAVLGDAYFRGDAAALAGAQKELASARRAANVAARRLGLTCRH